MHAMTLITFMPGSALRVAADTADRFLNLAREALFFLVQNPEAGPHLKWRIRHKKLRFWVIGRTNYIISYFADESGISIERILDGRRDVKRVIEQRLENPREEGEG